MSSPARRISRGADQQPALAVLGGQRMGLGLLHVLDGDQADGAVVVVDDDQPLDAVLLQQRAGFRLGRALAGLGFGIISELLFAFAPTTWLLLGTLPIYALAGLSGGPFQSIATREVQPNQQGQLQGALTALRSMVTLVTPGLYTGTFALFVGPLASDIRARSVVGTCWRPDRPRALRGPPQI